MQQMLDNAFAIVDEDSFLQERATNVIIEAFSLADDLHEVSSTNSNAREDTYFDSEGDDVLVDMNNGDNIVEDDFDFLSLVEALHNVQLWWPLSYL